MKTPTLLLTPIALTSVFLGANIAQAQTYTPSDGSGRTITFGTNQNSDAPLLSVNPSVFFNVSRLNIGESNWGDRYSWH